jgi:hypothetical protein
MFSAVAVLAGTIDPIAVSVCKGSFMEEQKVRFGLESLFGVRRHGTLQVFMRRRCFLNLLSSRDRSRRAVRSAEACAMSVVCDFQCRREFGMRDMGVAQSGAAVPPMQCLQGLLKLKLALAATRLCAKCLGGPGKPHLSSRSYRDAQERLSPPAHQATRQDRWCRRHSQRVV